MKRYRKVLIRSLAWGSLALAATISLPVVYVAALMLSGNFHVVADGAVYRSAQPSAASLRRYAEVQGIRSVLNLRDADSAQDSEGQTAQHLGIAYFHFPLSAVRLPTAHEIDAVMKILADAPKPILVHSYFGSDRAGLVSALYLFAIERRSAREAASQLSPRYGHLDFPGNPAAAMDQAFNAVVSVYGPPATSPSSRAD